MFKSTVEVTNSGLVEAYAQLLEKAPDVTNTLVNRTVNDRRDGLLAAFRKEPDGVSYPIQWKSAKQRKAYFATRGFGHGIPYQRTHALVNAWRLIVVYEANRLTSIAIENDDPKRRYVTGQDQQPFHRITGWYQDQDLIDKTQAQLADEVETDLIKGFYAVEDA